MSLSVGAIKSYSGTTNVQTPSKRAVAAPQQNDSAVSFGNNGLRRARNWTLATIMGVPVAVCSLSSCDKDGWLASAKAEAYVTGKDSCCCCNNHGYYIPDTIIKRDTTFLPGDTIEKRDTIFIPGDSVYIKDNYGSPVIDTLNAILDDLDIDRGKGYVPLRISFIDEQNSKFRKNVFDGKASGIDQVIYKATNTPWDEDMGRYIVGTPADEHEMYMLSLTEDGKLYVTKLIPKNGATNYDKIDNFMMAPTNFVFDRDRAAKLIRKFDVARDQVGRQYGGTYEKGDLPKSIMITNPYDTKWRYTDINVVSGDPYYGENE